MVNSRSGNWWWRSSMMFTQDLRSRAEAAPDKASNSTNTRLNIRHARHRRSEFTSGPRFIRVMAVRPKADQKPSSWLWNPASMACAASGHKIAAASARRLNGKMEAQQGVPYAYRPNCETQLQCSGVVSTGLIDQDADLYPIGRQQLASCARTRSASCWA